MKTRFKRLVWMIKQWEKLHWLIPLMLLFTIISNSAAIAYPLVFRKLINLLASILESPADFPEPMKQVHKLLMLFLAIGLGQFVAGFYPLIRGAVNNLFAHRLRMRYFKHIEEKDYSFFQHFRTGDIVTRLNDDNSSFILCSGIFKTLDSLLIVLFGIIVMFSINTQLTLMSLAPVPLILIAVYITLGKLVTGSQKNLEAISSINNQLEMSFSGIRIIKSFVSEAKYNRFFEDTLNSRIKTELRLVKLLSIQHLVLEYMDYFAQIGVILFGGWLAVKGSISIGTFFLFYTYLSIMLMPLFSLPYIFVTFKQAMVSINRLEEMKDFPLQYPEQSAFGTIESLQSICYEAVSFTYPEKDKAVINNCSFSLERGEKMLILGATGCGKTTVTNLLSGILHPNAGKILINGIELDKLDINNWRSKIGCVPQEALLFEGTVKENILFAAENADDSAYDLSIGVAQLKNELKAFPDGDNTLIGNKGQTVSGGQKQRITIARAVVKKPECLILDDITASLDAENEEKLWMELNTIFTDITCLVVSQRLSTLRYVDSILFIDEQGDCYKGTHEELSARNKEYAMFVMDGARD